MSQFITEAFVSQFNSNVMHLSQQQGSRLERTVNKVTIKGKTEYFDRVGQVAAIKKVGRHSSTPQLDTPHSRRAVTTEDYQWADMIDEEDKIRMLIDPTSDYALEAAWAFGRSKDDVIIAAALGVAATGENGQTNVALPDSQKYAANDGTAFSNMNILTLRRVKSMMDKKEVIGKRYMAVTTSQVDALLGTTQVTSADYNTVKALVQGEVNAFMGFEFIRTERLVTQPADGLLASPTTGVVGAGSSVTGFRKCFAYTDKAINLAVGADFMTKIDPRPDKSYATQVYARMSIGAVRMEEEQVVEVLCKES